MIDLVTDDGYWLEISFKERGKLHLEGLLFIAVALFVTSVYV